jgi:hypothetical protein
VGGVGAEAGQLHHLLAAQAGAAGLTVLALTATATSSPPSHSPKDCLPKARLQAPSQAASDDGGVSLDVVESVPAG